MEAGGEISRVKVTLASGKSAGSAGRRVKGRNGLVVVPVVAEDARTLPGAAFLGKAARDRIAGAARAEGFRDRKKAVLLVDRAREPWRGGARKGKARDEAVGRFLQAAAEGWLLGDYSHTRHRTGSHRSPVPSLEVLLKGGDARRGTSPAALRSSLRAAEVIAGGVILARDLANEPANEINPVTLAGRARSLARSTGLKCRILDEAAIRRERMGGLIGVGQGSDVPPRFIVLEHAPGGSRSKKASKKGSRSKRDAPLVFVGKAVTFDSGGISIKPAKGMEEMKADMSGGAAVIAALAVLAKLGAPRRVIGLVPCAENMISGRATRPGDVLETRSGITVEVVNTDAEGRLILADALDYARGLEPSLVVDLATLTGACVVALGHHVAGAMTNDRAAIETVKRAAGASGERIWELPLLPDYEEALKSDVADLKNSGGRAAGAITAAAFLARFIEGVPWVHLDIAGTAWNPRARGYLNRGATGAGVRMLVELALGG